MLRRDDAFRPNRTLLNPRADEGDLGGGERLAPAGHHVVVALGQRNATEEFALRGLAGDDGASLFESIGTGVEAEFTLREFGVVTLETSALEDGQDLARKIHRRSTEARPEGKHKCEEEGESSGWHWCVLDADEESGVAADFQVRTRKHEGRLAAAFSEFNPPMVSAQSTKLISLARRRIWAYFSHVSSGLLLAFGEENCAAALHVPRA
jgi:hypothetical protein